MHLFLYQSARHSTTQWGNRHRYKQGTIRGDFDLELLKNGIKGRFKILPHGTHPFQQILAHVDMEEEFYGHIVQIEDKRNAVWFKLNYDQVGKNVTKYLGGWNNLNPDDISSKITEYKMHKTAYNTLYGQMGQVRHEHSHVSSFLSPRLPRHHLCDKALTAGKKFMEELSAAHGLIEREVAYEKDHMVACQQAIRDYMKSQKL